MGEYDARIEAACKLLPAWFVPRMMSDEWAFGLMLTTGTVLAVEHIDDVRQAADGSLWLDVRLGRSLTSNLPALFCAPTTRTEASVAVAHVMAAFELADT